MVLVMSLSFGRNYTVYWMNLIYRLAQYYSGIIKTKHPLTTWGKCEIIWMNFYTTARLEEADQFDLCHLPVFRFYIFYMGSIKVYFRSYGRVEDLKEAVEEGIMRIDRCSIIKASFSALKQCITCIGNNGGFLNIICD